MAANKKINKVLLVTPTFIPDVGGVETMLENFCGYLAHRKYHVDVVTYSPLIVKTKAPRNEKLNESVTVHRIPWIGFGLFNALERYLPLQFLYLVPGLFLGTIIFLLKKNHRPDVIHTFGLSGVCAGGLASRIFKVPCVADMCTVYRFPNRRLLAWVARMLLGWPDYIRANNFVGRQELIDIGINPDKLGIITPPVDESVFKPIPQAQARAKLDLPAEEFIALFVGRMVDSKQVDIAADATRLITNSNVTFVFIGEGPHRQYVEEAARDDERIIIKNNVQHSGLVDYYNAADVLMCAPVDKELIAFVGREALMCGLPIIAPDVAVYFGIPYKVDDDMISPEIGCLFDSTAEGLAMCINELVKTRTGAGRYPFDRAACRKFAMKNFSTVAMDWLGDSYEIAYRKRFGKEEARL